MKKIIMCLSLSLSLQVMASGKIALDQVFVIKNGFDDNDDVQIVIDGKLLNTCYRLGETKVSVDANTKNILIEQFAELSEFSACAGGILPSHLNYPISFSKEISLGRLESGEYKVNFMGKNNIIVSNIFSVVQAPVNTVDNWLYAPVTQAIIPELIYETNNAEVILSGIFYSSCLALNSSDIKILREDNVIIILPYLTVYDNADCENKTSPLSKIINLGAFKEGRYLLHIRSLSGRAVNKTFTVVKKENDFGSGFPFPFPDLDN